MSSKTILVPGSKLTRRQFDVIVKDWLTPLGYTKIYDSVHAIQHEVHYAKDGIRVICVYKNDNNYHAHLYADIFTKTINVGLQSAKLPLKFENLEPTVLEFQRLKCLLQNK